MKYFAENRFDSGIHETAVIEKDGKHRAQFLIKELIPIINEINNV